MTDAIVHTCRSQHQHWESTLAQSEQEIDQLLSLLDELPSANYRSVRYHTIEYAYSLNRLKDRIHRLRLDVVCTGAGCCGQTAATVCTVAQFAPSATGNALISSLSTEYDRIKGRCHTFLTELMRLNLI